MAISVSLRASGYRPASLRRKLIRSIVYCSAPATSPETGGGASAGGASTGGASVGGISTTGDPAATNASAVGCGGAWNLAATLVGCATCSVGAATHSTWAVTTTPSTVS